jgi:hypothetical protein
MIFQWRENNQFVLIYAMPRQPYRAQRSVVQQDSTFPFCAALRRAGRPRTQARWSFPVPSPIDVETDKPSDNRKIN